MKKFMFAAIAAMVMVSVSNVFASSRMVSNAEVTPVDTVAPETPADTLATGTSIQPQAGVEDLHSRKMRLRLQQRMLQSSRQLPSKR